MNNTTDKTNSKTCPPDMRREYRAELRGLNKLRRDRVREFRANERVLNLEIKERMRMLVRSSKATQKDTAEIERRIKILEGRLAP